MQPPEYCLLGIDWWPLCMTKAEWSGWMQAIGTVAAILAAVGVAYVQHRQNLAQQKVAAAAERGRSLAAPLAVAERTVWQIENYLRELKVMNGHNELWGAPPGLKEELQRLVVSFESLRIESLPSYDLVHAAQEIRDHFRIAAVQLERMAHTKDMAGNITGEEVAAVVATIQTIKTFIEVLLVEWRQARAAEAGSHTSGRVAAVHDV